MMQALNDANVAIYALDLAGIGVRHPWRDSLNLLATDTGGSYYDNLNSYDNILTIVSDENSGVLPAELSQRKPARGKGLPRSRREPRESRAQDQLSARFPLRQGLAGAAASAVWPRRLPKNSPIPQSAAIAMNASLGSSGRAPARSSSR